MDGNGFKNVAMLNFVGDKMMTANSNAKWRVSIGMGGGFGLESLAGLNQNEWRFSLEYAEASAPAKGGRVPDVELDVRCAA